MEWTYNTPEVGGFFDFYGNWVSLTNTIRAQITDFTYNLTSNYDFNLLWTSDNPKLQDKESKIDLRLPWKNVSKLKHIKWPLTGEFMLIYEIWNQTDYQYTAYRVLDAFAAPLVNETRICHPIRLHRTDPVRLDEDGNVQILEAKDGYVNIYTIERSFDPRWEDDAKRAIASALVLLAMMVIIY
jgi:hypothetical protein